MKPSVAGRTAVWTAAISASALVPHAAPVALGLAAAKEGFDLLHARMHRTSVLSYIRAADADTYLSVAPSGATPGVVLRTASSLAGPTGNEEGAGPVPAHNESHRSGADPDPGEFCIKHRTDWLSYATAQARNRQDAEDAVSDVAEKIVRYHRRTGMLCPPEFDDPVAWSKKVINNYIKDLNKCARTRIKYQTKLYDPPDDFTEDIFDEMDAREAFKLIRGLNPTDHQIAVMYFIDGLKPKDIARILGQNVGTVRGSLHRTRKRMRRQLGIANEPKRIIPREGT
jgi:RNA polymerase sigma factor (sigma-70 family)